MSQLQLAYRFVFLCLSQPTQRTRSELRNFLRDSRWDWECLIRVATAERILPALYEKIQEFELSEEVPPEILEFLATVEQLNGDRNQHTLGEAASAAKLLNDIGIVPVVLKGVAYILTGTYRDPAARYLTDIDLLVPASQLGEAAETLQLHGYALEDCDAPRVWHHHYPVLLGPGNVAVELHRSVGLGICDSLLSGREIIQDSSVLELHGAQIRIPSPEHLIAHHVAHSQLQNRYRERIWPSLRGMYDLLLLNQHFQAELDWHLIGNRFRLNRRYGILAVYLLLIGSLLGMDKPAGLRISPFHRLRWRRRQFLRSVPFLRHFDPIYILWSTIFHRVHLLWSFQRAAGGWGHVLSMPFRLRFYRHLRKYGLRRAACDGLDWSGL